MGTKIIEQGSTAAGIAKVQYLDESGNVLYEVNDSDKIFKMVNGKISGLAGTGTRMVVADSTGNLSASTNKFKEIYVEGSTSTVGNDTWITICDCPVGSTDVAVTTQYESFDTTTLYYSQAGFVRATGGDATTLYVANGGMYGTQIRLNGNSIEAKQTSGAPNAIIYRYTTKNTRN